MRNDDTTTMQKIDPKRITDRLEAGTLARGEWGNGEEWACLLAAIHPPCAKAASARPCPASLMPKWMADLTIEINDAPSHDAHHDIIRRFAALAGRWWVLDKAAWDRLRDGCLRLAMEAAEAATPVRPLYPPARPLFAVSWAMTAGASADDLINAVLDAIDQEINDAQ